MRLPRKKRKIPVFHLPRKKTSLFFILFILCLVGGFLFADRQLRPTIQAKAEAHARVIATTSINQAIQEKVAKNIRYEDLISVKVDNRGRVVLMQPNTGEINRLASDATIAVQQLMKKIERNSIYIPLGQLLGSQILAGRGPDIPIAIVPVGTWKAGYMTYLNRPGSIKPGIRSTWSCRRQSGLSSLYSRQTCKLSPKFH